MKKSFHKSKNQTNLLPDSLAYTFQQSARLVTAVIEGHNLTNQFEKKSRENSQWSDSTRGAIRDLSWSTLRHYGEGDAVLAHFLHHPPPAFIRALLLVALRRLEQRPEQTHTIVNQAVIAAETHYPNLKGMVNGVLRNIIRNVEKLPEWKTEQEEGRFKHPQWWIEKLQKSYPEQWQTILEAGNTHPPMALRINPHRVSNGEEIQNQLLQQNIPSRFLENGALLLDKPVRTSLLPGYSAGQCSVQDAGAQWAAQLLATQTGDRVLDACAAPGGKTAHLLESNTINLLALEQDPSRTQQIYSNLERLGLSAEIRTTDCRLLKNWWDGQYFNHILADVPCSASGIVRRHPDIKWLRRSEDIAIFAKQQAEIIDALWQTLAPGGTMLYATCSVFEEENRSQIKCFCERHSNAEILPINNHMDFQLLPTTEHDGFYYARLRKTA